MKPPLLVLGKSHFRKVPLLHLREVRGGWEVRLSGVPGKCRHPTTTGEVPCHQCLCCSMREVGAGVFTPPGFGLIPFPKSASAAFARGSGRLESPPLRGAGEVPGIRKSSATSITTSSSWASAGPGAADKRAAALRLAAVVSLRTPFPKSIVHSLSPSFVYPPLTPCPAPALLLGSSALFGVWWFRHGLYPW